MDGSVTAAKMPETAKQRGKIAPAHVVLKTPPDRVKLVLDWYKTVLEAEAMFETDHFALHPPKLRLRPTQTLLLRDRLCVAEK